MLGMNINKVLIFVILITVLIQGASALDNVNVGSKVLAVGETWDIGYGWILTVSSIDVKASPGQVWFVLSKDGVRKDDVSKSEGQTYVYNEIEQMDYADRFHTKINKIWTGPTGDSVEFKDAVVNISPTPAPVITPSPTTTILENYPDGGAKHITFTIPLEHPKLINQNWTCPLDRVTKLGSGENYIVRIDGTKFWDGRERQIEPCKAVPIPSDYAYIETKEAWLNPYGQIISWKYVERAKYANLTTVYRLIPETIDEATNSSDWQILYIDSEGNVVSYTEPVAIPSNRTIKPKIEYPAGYGLDKAMQDLNLSRTEAMSEANYDRIKAEAFNHSPEYMQKRIQELESQQATVNETVTQHATWLDRILNWINQSFSVDLR